MGSEVVVSDIEGDGQFYDAAGHVRGRPAGKLVQGRPSKKSLADAQRLLSDNQLRLAVWLAMPEAHRRPSTRRELAVQLGVTEATLWRWSKIPDVIMAVRWLALQAAGDIGHVSNVLDYLYSVTQDADERTVNRMTAARDWLKAVGVYEAFKYDNSLLSVKSVEQVDLDALSNEELWDLYNTMSAQVGLDGAVEADRAVGDDPNVVTVGEVVDSDG